MVIYLEERNGNLVRQYPIQELVILQIGLVINSESSLGPVRYFGPMYHTMIWRTHEFRNAQVAKQVGPLGQRLQMNYVILLEGTRKGPIASLDKVLYQPTAKQSRIRFSIQS